ncbi:type VI secretion system-associated FHA domain protein TagH [uncultured Amphritea sp.]|uniref:type VI secretion system-associated FHA domain protein TagH n=1 Tax=uncultured Amphritea sp. TaxID=981605 RepID=UPI002602FDDE|nr:type VI secretion system-associated FHA domain protein TagH [uncultured Amphritea sp.]
MKIRITLIAFRGIAPARKVEKVFSGEDFTIGRADDNEIVLEDPDRYCSRYHVRCYQISGSYYLEDISSPGTQLNAGQFITRGQRHKLQDGDCLIIGENQLLVSVEDDEPVRHQQTSQDSFSIDDFFSETEADLAEHHPVSRVAPLPNIPLGNTADFYRAPKYQSSVDSEDHNPFDFSDLSLHVGTSNDCTADVSGESLSAAYDDSASEGLLKPAMPYTSDVDESVTAKNQVAPESMSVEQSQAQSPALNSSELNSSELNNSELNNSELHIDSRAIRAFLDGLGLKSEDLIGRNKVEIMHAAGEMLKILTKGTMEILQTRSDIKREFGMDVTRIGAVRNNPLKFCHSIEDAMLIMLTHSEGYLGPQEAVLEGVVDVKAHQVAVMSGMQAALTALLKRFEPAALESQLNVRFTLSKKSRYWDLYTTAYQQLQHEAQDSFHGLYGDEFSRVYEEQVRQIHKVLSMP